MRIEAAVPSCLKPTGASPPAAAETTGGQQNERTATCPASECRRAHAKVEILPSKKNVEVVV